MRYIIYVNNTPLIKKISFIKTLASDIKVAAISSSSSYVVNRVINKIDKDLNLIIEQGPGDGVMSKALLSKLSPNGSLVLIESNLEFVQELKKIKDKRITIFHGTVQDFYKKIDKNYPKADLVVSSIPFTLVKKTEREQIIKQSFEMLTDSGSIIIFHQYSLLMSKYVKKYFKNISNFFEPRNIMPCFIIVGKKQ